MHENNFIIVSNYNNQDAVASPVMDFDQLAAEGVEGFGLRLDNSYAANYAKARATKRAVFGVWRHRWQWDHDYVNSDDSVAYRDRAKVSFAEIRGIVTTNIPDAFILVIENKDECTPVNLWKTFRHLCEALWEKYRVPVLVSTSKGFINASFAHQGSNLFTDWLSRENKTKADARFPFVCVNWRNEASTPATLYIPNPIRNVKDAATALPALAPTENAEMKAGNSDWYGWEFGRTSHPAVTGGTLRLILLKDTPADVWRYLWPDKVYPGPYAGTATPPPSDPDPETPPPASAVTLEAFNALAARVAELERWRRS